MSKNPWAGAADGASTTASANSSEASGSVPVVGMRVCIIECLLVCSERPTTLGTVALEVRRPSGESRRYNAPVAMSLFPLGPIHFDVTHRNLENGGGPTLRVRDGQGRERL